MVRQRSQRPVHPGRHPLPCCPESTHQRNCRQPIGDPPPQGVIPGEFGVHVDHQEHRHLLLGSATHQDDSIPGTLPAWHYTMCVKRAFLAVWQVFARPSLRSVVEGARQVFAVVWDGEPSTQTPVSCVPPVSGDPGSEGRSRANRSSSAAYAMIPRRYTARPPDGGPAEIVT